MIRKLLNTTVFRLSLVYALLFSLIAAGAMGFIYWRAEMQISDQTDSRLRLEASILMNRYRQGAVEGLLETIRWRNQDEGRRFYALIPRGQFDLTRQFKPDWTSPDLTQRMVNVPQSEVMRFLTLTLGGFVQFSTSPHENAMARILVTLMPGGYQLLIGTDMDEQKALLRELLAAMLVAISIIFAFAILGGSLMGYNVLRRINAVGKTANDIISGDLTQRMPVTRRNDEFDRLSRVLNTMLERIEQLMQGMREVTDNLAHDLRNPLNRLRNRLEAGQFLPPGQMNSQQLVQDAIQDVDELIKTFNALLSIAQAESGIQRDDWTDVDLHALLEDLADLYVVVAEEEQIELRHASESGLHVHGNRQLLAQLITNLLDNAVKYTPAGGVIHLNALKQADGILLQVADNGPGIPAEQREQVFKRFHRLDNARSTPGNGLGLSLVKAVADLHHARIELDDNQPGLKVSLLFAASGDKHEHNA